MKSLHVKRIIISAINSFVTKEINIAVFILAGIFLISKPVSSVSEDSIDLGGKYKNYNVILIILDALRPDFLSCYGYPKKTSPNIDVLAKQGIVFDNAFSQSSLTLPSVVTIFTSLYPQSHNVKSVFKDKVPERVYTLAQILTFYDYDTVWFGSLNDPHSGSADGVLKGFKEKYSISYDKILSWLKRHRKKTFFITIHSYITHEKVFPYLRLDNEFSNNVSREFRDFFVNIQRKWWKDLQKQLRTSPDNIYATLGKDWVNRHKDYFFQPFSRKKLKMILDLTESPQQRLNLIKLWQESYFPLFSGFSQGQLSDFFLLLDGAILESDKNLIGPLLKALQRLNIFNKTIIIITSDHGNEYNEHGNIGHGQFLYDESIHIPLILYIPGLYEPLRKEALVQGVDILPSILHLVKIPLPYQAQGLSFVNVIQKKEKELPSNEFVFAQSTSGLQCIRSRHWKLIQNPNNRSANELFNLKDDPSEQKNILKENKQIAEELEMKLNNWKTGLNTYTENNGEFSSGIDEQTRENIRKTGYW